MAALRKPTLNLDKAKDLPEKTPLFTQNQNFSEKVSYNNNVALFELIFPNVPITPSADGEIQVLSPIPRGFDNNGIPYFEDHPSASVNINKGLFFDYVDNKSGCTLPQLLQKVKGFKKYEEVDKFIKIATSPNHSLPQETKDLWEENTPQKYDIWEKDWFFGRKVCEELQLKWSGKDTELFTIPVYFENKLLDLRTYFPTMKPKIKSIPGAKSGLMVGENLWKRDIALGKPTIICAGEKDMLAIRTLGFNAITFTGGEGTIPKLYLPLFNGKKVYIAYDHDKAGEEGMEKLGWELTKYGAHVGLIKKHYTDEKLKNIHGGDMWDMVSIYLGLSKVWVDHAIEDAIMLVGENFEQLKNKFCKFINLNDVTKEEHAEKWRQSTIQVLSKTDARYILPSSIVATKYQSGDNEKHNQWMLGASASWDFDEDNPKELLEMIKDTDKMDAYIRSTLLRIPKNEEYVKVDQLGTIHIFKSLVENYTNVALESVEGDSSLGTGSSISNETFIVYAIGDTFEVGNKYKIKYKYMPNPLDRQSTILFVAESEEIESLKDFEVTQQVKDHIRYLQQQSGNTIEEKLEFFYEQDLARVKKFNNFDLWLTTCLTFNSCLIMPYVGTKIRGYLDTICIGETRSGKSQIAKALVVKYGLGRIINADSSTTQAFLGGSTTGKNGADMVKCGSLEKEKNGIVVVEEIKDKANELFSKIRSLRSSQILKIDRVSGGFEKMLFVRMLFLTNPRTKRTSLIDMRTNFGNGLEVLSSVVESNEDQTRFDLIYLVDSPDNIARPTPNQFTYKYAEIIEDDYFKDAIRLVWTRKPEQIVFEDGVEQYLDEVAMKFKEDCNGMHNIYSTEVCIKFTRIAVSLAGLLLSFDETYTNLVVKKEHVDYVDNYINRIYYNDLFKLSSLIAEQNKKTKYVDNDVKILQDIVDGGGSTLLNVLNNLSMEGVSSNEVQKLSGISDYTLYNNYYTTLFENRFIELVGNKLVTTQKFGKVFLQINNETNSKPREKRLSDIFIHNINRKETINND